MASGVCLVLWHPSLPPCTSCELPAQLAPQEPRPFLTSRSVVLTRGLFMERDRASQCRVHTCLRASILTWVCTHACMMMLFSCLHVEEILFTRYGVCPWPVAAEVNVARLGFKPTSRW